MKKAISLLVAMVLSASIGVAAFAAEDVAGTNGTNDTPETPETTGATDTTGTGGAAITDDTTPMVRALISSGDITAGNETITINKGELYLVDAGNQVVGGIYNLLDPGTEYTFRIHYATDDITEQTSSAVAGNTTQGAELTGKALAGGTIRLRTVRGSSHIQSARIKTIGRGDTARYELVLTTRNTYGTKMNEVEYSLGVTGSTNETTTFKDSGHIFQVGWRSIPDDETQIGEGGYITISNDYPVITKEQFTAIAKSVNYKTVNFEGEDAGWLFTGRVSGMGDTNFHYTYDVTPELINLFPEQDFKFLTFNAGVTFPASGEMHIDVSDVSEAYGRNLYTYLYRNGKLTLVDTTYDVGANEVVFRTNYLGSFVITDRAITNTSIVGEENKEEEEEEVTPNENTDNETNNNVNNIHGNPQTGAASAMNAIVALGLATVATAGAILPRKRK